MSLPSFADRARDSAPAIWFVHGEGKEHYFEAFHWDAGRQCYRLGGVRLQHRAPGEGTAAPMVVYAVLVGDVWLSAGSRFHAYEIRRPEWFDRVVAAPPDPSEAEEAPA
jgi:hypothetical protein